MRVLNGNWLVAAGENWKNSDRQTRLNIAPPIKTQNVYLLACVMYQLRSKGLPLVDLELCYKDGSTKTLPLVSGGAIQDWFLPGNRNAKPAVRWEAPGSKLEYGLFSCKLQNPEPDKELCGLKLTSTNTGIVAIKAVTLEKLK